MSTSWQNNNHRCKLSRIRSQSSNLRLPTQEYSSPLSKLFLQTFLSQVAYQAHPHWYSTSKILSPIQLGSEITNITSIIDLNVYKYHIIFSLTNSKMLDVRTFEVSASICFLTNGRRRNCLNISCLIRS